MAKAQNEGIHSSCSPSPRGAVSMSTMPLSMKEGGAVFSPWQGKATSSGQCTISSTYRAEFHADYQQSVPTTASAYRQYHRGLYNHASTQEVRQHLGALLDHASTHNNQDAPSWAIDIPGSELQRDRTLTVAPQPEVTTCHIIRNSNPKPNPNPEGTFQHPRAHASQPASSKKA